MCRGLFSCITAKQQDQCGKKRKRTLLLLETAKVVDLLNTSPGGFSFSSHQIQLRREIIHESILLQNATANGPQLYPSCCFGFEIPV